MAAKNFGRVNVSVTASTGGLTAGLGRASKQLRGFGGQTQGIGARLQSMAAGFVGAGRGASAAAIGVRALGLAVKALLGPLLILTSLVGIFARFGKAARDLDAVSKTARRLGMEVASFQNLGQAAQEAGVGIEQLGTLMTFMTRNIGNLTNGSTAAQSAFGRLGLTLQDIRGLKPEEQFELISKRIMALPTAAQRTAAAIAIFGRQGAMAMNLISDASTGAVSDIAKLREQLGLNMTDAQTKGIEMMNDALGRLTMVFDGFINQFLAELAPTITTIANLFVQFFATNTEGWTLGKSLGMAFGGMLRLLVGYWTVLYGAGQLVFSFYAKGFSIMLSGVSMVMKGYSKLNAVLLQAAEALGFTSIAGQLRNAQKGFDKLAETTAKGAEIAAGDAANAWKNGLENLTNPFGAFDAEFAKVTEQMNKAGQSAGEEFTAAAADGITKAVRASSAELKAIVVGTGEGEAFRNSILRGADPRLDGDAARETADNTAEMVDELEDLNANVAGLGGLGTASIAV
jgi:hypothetical protein